MLGRTYPDEEHNFEEVIQEGRTTSSTPKACPKKEGKGHSLGSGRL
jgi:hypothetical protein